MSARSLRRIVLFLAVSLLFIAGAGACKTAARKIATQLRRDELVRDHVYYESSRDEIYGALRKAARDDGFDLPRDPPESDDSVETSNTKKTGGDETLTVRFEKSQNGLQLEVTKTSEHLVNGRKQRQEVREGNLEFAALEALEPKTAKDIMKQAEKGGREDAEKFAGCAKRVIDQ